MKRSNKIGKFMYQFTNQLYFDGGNLMNGFDGGEYELSGINLPYGIKACIDSYS
jgi:hypothetical protein